MGIQPAGGQAGPTGSFAGREELGAAWFPDHTERIYTGCRLPQHVPATTRLVRYWSVDRVSNSHPHSIKICVLKLHPASMSFCVVYL